MLPALNEEITVGETIKLIPREMAGISRLTVLVVDDGSTDRTVEVSRAVGAEVISHGYRRGVGAAFQTGLARAIELGADLMVNIDADGQFDPRTIPRLIAPVLAGEADFTTASRFKDPALVPVMPPIKLWGNRMMSRLISSLVGQRFYDVSCGMRCYNRRAALSLNVIGEFTYTQEVFLNLAHKHMRLLEVPIRVEGVRKYGKSRVASNLFGYALKTSTIIFRSYRDYQPLRFFGLMALFFMVLGLGFEVFLFAHYLHTGGFTPHKWAGFVGAALFVIGLPLLMLGILGDMLNRHRLYLEETLYHLRKAPPPGPPQA
jgi:glycosyltransferase involved in cell wall biosynthesis